MHHGFEPERQGQLVILDNRDSFVFNLAHRLHEIGQSSAVIRSDTWSLERLIELKPSGLIVSPGPGHPDDAGVSVEAIRYFAGEIPILGVCLGHQALAVSFGGTVDAGGRPVHGMASAIRHDETAVFEGIPQQFDAARYHSLVVTDIGAELVANAWADGFIMGLRHQQWPVYGVQFHPESVLTDVGRGILSNFCRELRHEERSEVL